MRHLAIPDSEKATGILWLVYLVIMRDWEWWIAYGEAELTIQQGIN